MSPAARPRPRPPARAARPRGPRRRRGTRSTPRRPRGVLHRPAGRRRSTSSAAIPALICSFCETSRGRCPYHSRLSPRPTSCRRSGRARGRRRAAARRAARTRWPSRFQTAGDGTSRRHSGLAGAEAESSTFESPSVRVIEPPELRSLGKPEPRSARTLLLECALLLLRDRRRPGFPVSHVEKSSRPAGDRAAERRREREQRRPPSRSERPPTSRRLPARLPRACGAPRPRPSRASRRR